MSGPVRRFARIPESVLCDPELSHVDGRVYGAASYHCIGGNNVTLRQRRIAELAHVDRRTARRSLTNLARHGHISVSVVKLLKRTVYQLNSPIFVEEKSPALGGEERPILGVVERPRI